MALHRNPTSDAMDTLFERLKKLEAGFRMGDNTFLYLMLSCEETFFHLVEYAGSSDMKCRFSVRFWGEGFFVEVSIGETVHETDQGMRPFTGINATEAELDRVGLLIFSRMAKDVAQIHISGYTYIYFVILFVQPWSTLWAQANFVGGWQGCF
ncbi:hypothetical protein OOT00_09575 [Desulfobotulus sp. H1]|uniref:Uncharacterized protein n=1 Tax=Desulfobotulus pelophilus TaxID=2823377 RepID=A0ABT3N9U6_9BACT|nr:hypothetical protein [Desulfobotulus pelophilus]MCW7754235.1 hypothetical protein [Desulfobotulus pelophilus]